MEKQHVDWKNMLELAPHAMIITDVHLRFFYMNKTARSPGISRVALWKKTEEFGL